MQKPTFSGGLLHGGTPGTIYELICLFNLLSAYKNKTRRVD